MKLRVLTRVLALFALGAVTLTLYIQNKNLVVREDEPNVVQSYIKEENGHIHVTISAIGDVALGQDDRFAHKDSFSYVYEKNGGDNSYFFADVVDILEQDDLTIANLETVLSNETKKVEKFDYGNNYWFNGKPKYAHILKSGSIEVVNLANNHIYDYGQKGYAATNKALNEAGVQHFGYSETLYTDVYGIRVGMAGFNQLGEFEQGRNMDALRLEVETMTKQLREESDLVIVSFHWGKEYEYEIDPAQTELAHLAIDSGADLVLGTHPHVLQPLEIYKERYIVYSLGNFCFGGNKRPPDFDTAIFRQTFEFDLDKSLRKIEMPEIIPCSISSSIGVNDYRPTVANGSRVKDVFAKLRYTPELSNDELVAYAAKKDMVRVDIAVKDAIIELKYATSDNITGIPIYDSNTAYLRKGTADKLKKASSILAEQGYGIKVWDAYRPQKCQERLFEVAKNSYYFMSPQIGSSHTRGTAVDITLVDAQGNELDMPSGFDEMSKKAHRTYDMATPEQKKNALVLENAMKEAGFLPLENEWWHFDDSEYKSYDFVVALEIEDD
jgi:poly-gamma-glutamate synthesis protein (capsule biosynthesis protein)